MEHSDVMAKFDKVQEGLLDLNIKYARISTLVGRHTIRMTFSGMDHGSYPSDLESIQNHFPLLRVMSGTAKDSIVVFVKGPGKTSIYKRG